MSKVFFRALQRCLCLLYLGTINVGSVEESGRGAASRSSSHHSFTTAINLPLQVPHDTNITEYNGQRTSAYSVLESADAVDSVKILKASHLSSLRDLISDKKITVSLGLRVSLSGPRELLDTQRLLLNKEKSGLYNTGEYSGLFSMRIVAVKKVT